MPLDRALLLDVLDEVADGGLAIGIVRLVEANPDTEFTLAHRGWPDEALRRVPPSVTITNLDETVADRS
jgi:7-cyano-7-deazaguanine tRNA-ribosyltransferase